MHIRNDICAMNLSVRHPSLCYKHNPTLLTFIGKACDADEQPMLVFTPKQKIGQPCSGHTMYVRSRRTAQIIIQEEAQMIIQETAQVIIQETLQMPIQEKVQREALKNQLRGIWEIAGST